MAKNILVVEDDKNVANLVTTYFENEKWNVKNAFDGENALDIDLTFLAYIAYIATIAAMVQLVEMIIERFSPSLYANIIKGLDLGADDYVTKPFSPKELVSRVKAIFRRIDKQNLFAKKKILTLKNMQIDVNLKIVLMHDVKVNLTPKEFSILQNLCSYPGKIYSRQEIIDLVFGLDFDGFDRTIDTHIANLRKKLKTADPDNDYVESVYGLGYRLIDA